RCTGRIARVRVVSAASSRAGSSVSVAGSTSQNTGRAPSIEIASAVNVAVCDTVTTSSPGPTPAASSARRIASVPVPTPTASPQPATGANAFSNAASSSPSTYQPRSTTRVSAAINSARTGASCTASALNGTSGTNGLLESRHERLQTRVEAHEQAAIVVVER